MRLEETMSELKELLQKIQNGDNQAFVQLIERYKRLVYNIVFRMVQNESDREDLCQDIFIKVYQNLGAFGFQAKFSTWIARIAVNTTINHLKKKKVPLFDDFSKNDTTIEDAVKDFKTPDIHAEELETSLKVEAEIQRLPVKWRTILTLFHIEEMSYTEIGEILNLPEGTVKSYLFRARKRLKEKLMNKYPQEELWPTNA